MDFKKIFENIVLHTSGRFLEVNPYTGYTTEYLSNLITKSGKDIKHYVITHTESKVNNVTSLRYNARSRFKNNSLSFIFFDNSINIIKDVILWYPILKKNGFMVGYKFDKIDLESILSERYVVIKDHFIHKKIKDIPVVVTPEDRKYRLYFGSSPLPGLFSNPKSAQLYAWRSLGYKVKIIMKELDTSDLLPEELNLDDK